MRSRGAMLETAAALGATPAASTARITALRASVRSTVRLAMPKRAASSKASSVSLP